MPRRQIRHVVSDRQTWVPLLWTRMTKTKRQRPSSWIRVLVSCGCLGPNVSVSVLGLLWSAMLCVFCVCVSKGRKEPLGAWVSSLARIFFTFRQSRHSDAQIVIQSRSVMNERRRAKAPTQVFAPLFLCLSLSLVVIIITTPPLDNIIRSLSSSRT